MSHPDRNFLHIQGFIHELDITPSGTAEDPWPLVLFVDSGPAQASAMIHRDDAELIVGFLAQHLGLEVAL